MAWRRMAWPRVKLWSWRRERSLSSRNVLLLRVACRFALGRVVIGRILLRLAVGGVGLIRDRPLPLRRRVASGLWLRCRELLRRAGVIGIGVLVPARAVRWLWPRATTARILIRIGVGRLRC